MSDECKECGFELASIGYCDCREKKLRARVAELEGAFECLARHYDKCHATSKGDELEALRARVRELERDLQATQEGANALRVSLQIAEVEGREALKGCEAFAERMEALAHLIGRYAPLDGRIMRILGSRTLREYLDEWIVTYYRRRLEGGWR